MNQFIKQSTVLIFVVILQIFCFFQVSSFIHLHHTHHEDGLQIIISVHPVDHHTPNHSDYHSNGHHHPSDDHHELDLTFVQSRLRKVHTLSAGFFFQSKVVTLIKPGSSNNIPSFYSYVPSKRIFSSSIFSRSPPNLSC